MIYIFFWLSFSCSFNQVFWTLFPYDQFLDQLITHNYSPIDKFSMICFRDHHDIFIAKILHLIFLVDNGQNCNNYIDILLPHLFYNPPFIGVVIIWDSISYVCQC
jgi:hypothetical protein